MLLFNIFPEVLGHYYYIFNDDKNDKITFTLINI